MNTQTTGSDSLFLSCFRIQKDEDVCAIRFDGMPQDLPGMEFDALRKLWKFLMREYDHPSRVLLLQLNEGLFRPDRIECMFKDYGICSADGSFQDLSEGMVAYLESFFLREVHISQRMVKWIMGIDDFTISSFGGEMVLPLFGVPLACDYRIVADDFIMINQMKNSIFSPMGGLPWLLTRILGRTRTRKLLMETKEIRAEEALAMGLVDRVVPRDCLEEESLMLASEVASWSWGVRTGLKRTLAAGGESLDSYFEVEEVVFEKALRQIGTVK
jgi:hypothetical protein